MEADHKFLQKTRTQIELRSTGIDGTCRFALATDSHYSEKDPNGDKHFGDALLKMEEFVQTVNQSACDFSIHLGDFKDEDEIPEHEATIEYLHQMESEFSRFKGPRFHCLGNHDLDSITKAEFLAKVVNTGIPPEKSYYSFVFKAIRFLVLDSNFDPDGSDHFFKEGGDWESPTLPEQQLSWLEKELSTSKHPCFVFCHHPLYAYVKNGHSYHVANYLQARKILEASGKVIAVFNGHMHEEMLHEINDIHYLAMNSMLEGTFVQRNCFYTVEIRPSTLVIDRYERINTYL